MRLNMELRDCRAAGLRHFSPAASGADELTARSAAPVAESNTTAASGPAG